MSCFLAHSLALTVSMSLSLTLVLFEHFSLTLRKVQVPVVEGVLMVEIHSHSSRPRRGGGALSIVALWVTVLGKRKEKEVGRVGGRPCVPTALFSSLAISHGLPVQYLHNFLWLKLSWVFFVYVFFFKVPALALSSKWKGAMSPSS